MMEIKPITLFGKNGYYILHEKQGVFGYLHKESGKIVLEEIYYASKKRGKYAGKEGLWNATDRRWNRNIQLHPALVTKMHELLTTILAEKAGGEVDEIEVLMKKGYMI